MGWFTSFAGNFDMVFSKVGILACFEKNCHGKMQFHFSHPGDLDHKFVPQGQASDPKSLKISTVDWCIRCPNLKTYNWSHLKCYWYGNHEGFCAKAHSNGKGFLVSGNCNKFVCDIHIMYICSMCKFIFCYQNKITHQNNEWRVLIYCAPLDKSKT